MIRKWEMALWAMVAGTTVMASCQAMAHYGMPWDADSIDYQPFDYSDPDSEVLDITGDPMVEHIEDAEVDEAEGDEDVDDDAEDVEDEG